MKINRTAGNGTGTKSKSYVMLAGLLLLSVSMLLAACGDSTATQSAAPASTVTAAATTAAATTSTATTAASTTAAATTAASTTSAAVTTAAASTAASSSGSNTGAGASGNPTVTVAGDTVQAGTVMQVTGTGFPANTWLSVQVGPGQTPRDNASVALTDANGKFTTGVILNSYGDGSKIQPGQNIVQVVSQDGKIKSSTTVNITAAPAPTPTK
ncbi:MAG TPA: hypothetical protein VH186_18865 [Chloroflexia bacterium]|nr:hypothetical protein [Chloroflexia bacterium]